MTEEDLKRAIHEALDSRARIDPDTHCEHHEWITIQIEAHKRRAEMYAAITSAVLQWSIPAIFGAVWYFFGHGRWPTGE